MFWSDKYLEVKKWVHVHKKLPISSSKDAKERSLGEWCDYQRKIDKRPFPNRSALREEQKRVLENLAGWYWKRNLEKNWFNRYNRLKQWVEIHGKFPSAESKNIEEKSLGTWRKTQQRNKRRTAGGRRITRKEKELLESIPGWKWDVNLDQKWLDKYNEVKQWFGNHGKSPTSYSKNFKERSLGNWCHIQRKIMRGTSKGRSLTKRQEYMLENLPVWYW